MNEALTWDDLLAQGLVARKTVSNGEIKALFQNTTWEDDDPGAADDPESAYLDLWVVDLGSKSIARAVLSPDRYDALQDFLVISDSDEPILVVETRGTRVGFQVVRAQHLAQLDQCRTGRISNRASRL